MVIIKSGSDRSIFCFPYGLVSYVCCLFLCPLCCPDIFSTWLCLSGAGNCVQNIIDITCWPQTMLTSSTKMCAASGGQFRLLAMGFMYSNLRGLDDANKGLVPGTGHLLMTPQVAGGSAGTQHQAAGLTRAPSAGPQVGFCPSNPL